MLPYPILCYALGCGRSAVYKIAAHWSDGLTAELKTYALSCAECLPELFQRSRIRQAACKLAHGEILEPPGVYRLERGQHDQQLERLDELERQLTSA